MRHLVFIPIFLIVLLLNPTQAQSKTHWKKGLQIGALYGAIAGGTSGAILGPSIFADDGQNGTQPDSSIVVGAIGAAGGAILFGAIGTAIGAAIKAPDKTAFVPIIQMDEHQSKFGMAFSRTF